MAKTAQSSSVIAGRFESIFRGLGAGSVDMLGELLMKDELLVEGEPLVEGEIRSGSWPLIVYGVIPDP